MNTVMKLVATMRKDRFDPVSKTIPNWVIMPVNLKEFEISFLHRNQTSCRLKKSSQYEEIFKNLEPRKASPLTTAKLKFICYRKRKTNANHETRTVEHQEYNHLETGRCE